MLRGSPPRCRAASTRRRPSAPIRSSSPYRSRPSAPSLEPLRARLLGKTVLDTAVPLSHSGGRFDLVHVDEGSAALQAQALLPGSSVAAAFQTISARDLLDAAHKVEGDVVVCSDDDAAKRLVMSLVERIPALRAVDGGGLASSRYVEAVTPLLLNVNRLYRARAAIRIVGI